MVKERSQLGLPKSVLLKAASRLYCHAGKKKSRAVWIGAKTVCNWRQNCTCMFSSFQSLDRLDRRRDTRVDSAEILFQSFLQKALVSNSGMGRNVHSLMLSIQHPCHPLPTTASPTLQGALKDGFREAVVACDMPEPCKCPSLYSCQKRFLWTFLVNRNLFWYMRIYVHVRNIQWQRDWLTHLRRCLCFFLTEF